MSVEDGNNHFTKEQETLMHTTFEKLKSYKSYWTRKSYILTIANRGILSKFQLQVFLNL